MSSPWGKWHLEHQHRTVLYQKSDLRNTEYKETCPVLWPTGNTNKPQNLSSSEYITLSTAHITLLQKVLLLSEKISSSSATRTKHIIYVAYKKVHCNKLVMNFWHSTTSDGVKIVCFTAKSHAVHNSHFRQSS